MCTTYELFDSYCGYIECGYSDHSRHYDSVYQCTVTWRPRRAYGSKNEKVVTMLHKAQKAGVRSNYKAHMTTQYIKPVQWPFDSWHNAELQTLNIIYVRSTYIRPRVFRTSSLLHFVNRPIFFVLINLMQIVELDRMVKNEMKEKKTQYRYLPTSSCSAFFGSFLNFVRVVGDVEYLYGLH